MLKTWSSKIRNFYDEHIKYYVDRIIFDPYNSITQGIPNLIKWFPIIWKDRDWDYIYLMIIMKKKLEYMKNYFEDYGIHAYKDRDIKEVKICILLIKRILDDEYHDNAFLNHDRKWGESKLSWNDIEGSDNLCELNIERKNVITEKDKEQEIKEHRRLYKHSDAMKKQDIDYLFNFMSKHIQGWWD